MVKSGIFIITLKDLDAFALLSKCSALQSS